MRVLSWYVWYQSQQGPFSKMVSNGNKDMLIKVEIVIPSLQ